MFRWFAPEYWFQIDWFPAYWCWARLSYDSYWLFSCVYELLSFFFSFLCRKITHSSLLCFFPVCLLYYSHITFHFWHVWSANICRFSPHPKPVSVTPARCLTISRNADTIYYLAVTSDLTEKGSVAQQCLPPPLDANCKPRLSSVLWLTGYRSGIPKTPSSGLIDY